MLTGDLVRARIDGGDLRPSLIEPERAALREHADALIDAVREAVEERWTRGRVDEEIETVIGDSRDHKLIRGLAKVLLDRAEFAVQAPVDPAELRDRVFRLARERGPLALERGPLERPVAEDVLAEVGTALDLDPAALAEALYADLREEQRIVSCEVPDGAWLLHRYNVALVQALLLHATEVRIRIGTPTVPRMRQLFRWVKFYQLVHSAERVGKELHITLDGPMSLFKQSTRYGMQLASFFPALLLQDGAFSLEATVLWTKRRTPKRVVVTQADGLRSHLADTGAWTSREQLWFAERWAATTTSWRMSDDVEPIDLGGKAVVLPDFTFTDGKRTAYLEIVGYWRRDWLERRVEALRRYGPGNLVLAVSRKLQGGKEALAGFAGEIVEFAEIVPPKAVIEALERVAR